MADSSNFSKRQGEYLAFIYIYTKLMGLPPAQKDIQRYFQVSPPSVHQMIMTLAKNGLLSRKPGAARSIRVLVPPSSLPILSFLDIDVQPE